MNTAVERAAQKKAAEDRKPVLPEAESGPHISRGPLAGDSQPFRFGKAFGWMLGKVKAENAKTEIEVMDRFEKAVEKAGIGHLLGVNEHTKMIPYGMEYMPDVVANSEAGRWCKAVVQSAGLSYDYDEYRRLVKATTPTQSVLDNALGGELVAPPVQGELIPLVRNKSALDRAGATTFPLPPNGRTVLPKEQTAATAFWVPENSQGNIQTTVKFGQVSSQAKKLMSLIVVPNEMFQFTSQAAEAILRNNMATSIALAYDYAGLYGDGTNGQPKGLINYTAAGELIDYSAATPAPTGVAVNGNVLKAQDGELMCGLIEDRNFDADEDGFGWLMRGRMFRRIRSIGADAVVAADEAGPFKFNLTRALGEKIDMSNWCGYKVTRSAQVRGTVVKGTSGATLTEVFGGVWSKCYLATMGVMAFDTFPGGLAEIQADQTVLRAKLFGDVIYTHPGAFIQYPQLKFTA